jgi:hypothetical protein
MDNNEQATKPQMRQGNHNSCENTAFRLLGPMLCLEEFNRAMVYG